MPDNKVHSGKPPGFLAKLRKIFGLNIGTVMFGAIFIYMIFSVILYLTASHMESYQVPSGPLSMNETYTGLAIMTENVVQADAGGYVTYYGRYQDQCQRCCLQPEQFKICRQCNLSEQRGTGGYTQ